MTQTYHNPYTGSDGETCSVSFGAQQKLKATGLSGQQTEAEFNQSKLLGEWGVIKGKVANGEIKPGTKVLSGVDTEATRVTITSTANPDTFFWKTYPADVHAKGVSVLYDKDLLNHLVQNAQVKWTVPNSSGAAPTPSPAVPGFSNSKGSMSDEDVATLFVTIKDKLAKEQGLAIKGANPALDKEVYDAIAQETGYTGAEAKSKVDNYKASGKKLSSLKKKTLKTSAKTPDPKPNDVPTVATSTVADKAAETVTKVAEDKPKKLYSNEDISAQYIIAKDAVVAASNGKWTLYSKSDELDAAIFGKVHAVTGIDMAGAKQAIADYLATGKKLSQLKKSLIKSGAMKAEADTLKGKDPTKLINTPDPDQSAKEVKEEVKQKAESNHTPPEAPEAGDIHLLSETVKSNVYNAFKGQPSGKYLTDTAPTTYKAILAVKHKFPDLTPLQILRIVDEQGAIKFKVDNGKLFEKKVVEWMTTPDGKSTVNQIIAEAKEAAEAAEAAERLKANQPPLPADSALFNTVTVEDAFRIQGNMTQNRPLTSREKKGLTYYTTNQGYTAMNGALRKGGGSDHTHESINQTRDGMRPSTEDILLHRGTGFDQFGHADKNTIWGYTGKLLEDKGFMSTSVGGKAAFSSKPVLMEIEVPRGTPMAFVKAISHYQNENEMLLQAGLKYRVLRVDEKPGVYGGSQIIVRVRIEP